MIKTANLENEIIDLTKELILLDNVNLPFSSLLMKKGTQKISSVITNWKYENLDNTRGLSLEGADVSTFQASDRSTGDKNVCQIITKAISVSDTAQAVSLDNISDLFAHELKNRMLEAKRDLEHYLINGVYKEDESGTPATPRQMKGLANFISEENTIARNSLVKADIENLTKIMKKAGTAGQNLVMLCDYNTYDVLCDLFADDVVYVGVTNEFGSPAKKINTKYASFYIYLVDAMPENTMILANMEYLKFASLRPLVYQDLAKTGSSRKGFIEMENTLKFLNPTAAVKFVLITDNDAPTLKVDGVTLDATKKVVTLEFSENVVNATANASALKAGINVSTDGSTFSALASGDKVAITNGKLVITFASALSTATNKIKVIANTLKDISNNVITEDIITGAIDATAE